MLKSNGLYFSNKIGQNRNQNIFILHQVFIEIIYVRQCTNTLSYSRHATPLGFLIRAKVNTISSLCHLLNDEKANKEICTYIQQLGVWK
jgi:hypothetical protein